MFAIREYAACVLAGLVLTALLLAVCGIGYLLKATGILVVRMFHETALRRATQKRAAMGTSSSTVIHTMPESSAMAD